MAAGAILLAIRFLAGPFHTAIVTVNSPVNAAAAVAVSFVLLVLLARERPIGTTTLRLVWVDLLLVVTASVAAFSPNLSAPFVFDDYTHIVQTSHATWRILLGAFQPVPGGHGLFFRPVGFISYWVDYQWAGTHAIRWHIWNLAVHTANTCLIYLLVRRLGMRGVAPFVAALLFALHGSRAETVAWSDARFDLLATFLVLCALLAAMGHCRTGRRIFHVPLAVCAALAVYTKESAFCLPLLPIALLPCVPRQQWRRALHASLTLALICAVLFAYRWWALGGIGGYIDRSGVHTVWRSRPLHTSEALLFRQWAFLFFPVNWTVPLEWWLRIAAVIFLAMLLLCAMRAGGPRARLLAGIAFLLAAGIPVQHLLMFQPDFAGARVLYLPLVGLAIFWAALLERCVGTKLTWTMAAVLIAFNVAALEHNLRPWRAVPAAAAAACHTLGSEMAKDPRPVFISGLPERSQGTYFLTNGFPECVEMSSGQAAARVHVVNGNSDAPAGTRRFVWNPRQDRLEELR